LLVNTIKYAKKNNLRIPNTILYIWISDRFPWYADIHKYVPIYVYSKIKDTDFPIFPDNTFFCFTFGEKYKGKCYNFDQTKKIINNNIFSEKENKVYFKGTATTIYMHKIRESLEEKSKFNISHGDYWFDIKLDGWINYESIYYFSKYKYLLNLPGRYPWSNRLKYLFLMKSMVINIDVETISVEQKYFDKKYVTLIDFIIKKNKHYKNITMKYYKRSRNNLQISQEDINNINSMNKKEVDIVYRKIEKLYNYYNKHPEEYNEIVNNGYKRVNKLKNKHIYQYIYNCIIKNSEFIN
jgi:hypothetical protein